MRYSGPCAPGEAEIRLTGKDLGSHLPLMDEAEDSAKGGLQGERPQTREPAGQAPARAAREARLAKALRDNLRRRKAPGRQGLESSPGPPEEP